MVKKGPFTEVSTKQQVETSYVEFWKQNPGPEMSAKAVFWKMEEWKELQQGESKVGED